MVKITRLYTGKDGESYFEEIEVEIEKMVSAYGVIFRYVLHG